MKALVLKEFLMIQSYLKWLIPFVLFFTVTPILLGDSNILLTFYSIISILLMMHSFMVDDTSQWNRFANTLPINRAEIVKSKYIANFILLVIFMVILLPVLWLAYLVTEPFMVGTEFETITVCFTMVIFAYTMLLPIFIKFGAKIGFLFFVLLLGLLPFMGGKILENYMSEWFYSNLFVFLESFTAPIIGLGLYVLSYFISVKIYENKEF